VTAPGLESSWARGRRAGLALALLGAGACGPKTAIEHGEALFGDPALGDAKNEFTCATCHEGAAPKPDLLLPGAPMRGVAKRPSFWGGAEINLLPSLNHCLVDMMERDDGLAANDADAEALWAYLEALSQTDDGADAVPFTVPAVPAIPPAGSATAGEIVYDRACKQCHGALHTGDGRLGVFVPILPEQTLAEHPDPDYTDADRLFVFAQKTRHGSYYGYGGSMPPFSLEVLPDADLGDLLAAFGF
jgi:thiosulfate dehydrogenase